MPLVFQKLSNFLKVSIFITRIGKPIIPKLLFFKKSATARHPNSYYGFVHHYQFSPSTATPLIHYHRSGRRRHVYSLLFPCRSCLSSGSFRDGNYRVEEAEEEAGQFLEALEWSEDEDDSIDHRAELFIQKFYADMKMEALAMPMPSI